MAGSMQAHEVVLELLCKLCQLSTRLPQATLNLN